MGRTSGAGREALTSGMAAGAIRASARAASARRGGRSALPWLVATALLAGALPAADAEPWLQYGYDAARTGATPDAGPATDDVAFEVRLNASSVGTPIIIDRHVYVLGHDLGYDCCPETGIYRIAIDSGEVVQVTPLEPGDVQRVLSGCSPGPGRLPLCGRTGWEDIYQVYFWASDGDRLFVPMKNAVRAYGLEGESAWEYRVPEPVTTMACADPAFMNGTVYLACQADREPGSRTFLLALDASNGRELWRASFDPNRYHGRSDPASSVGACERFPDAVECEGEPLWIPVALSVMGPYVVATAAQGTTAALAVRDWSEAPAVADLFAERFLVLSFQVFDRMSGAFLWGESNSGAYAGAASALSWPIGTESHLFYRLGEKVYAVNPTSKRTIWEADLGPQDAPGFNAGGVLALHGGSLLVAATKTVFRIDDVFGSNPRTILLAGLDRGTDDVWSPYGIAATGERVYLTASRNPDPARLYYRQDQIHVLDLATRELDPLGEPSSIGYPARLIQPVVGEGVLVLTYADGRVVVYGETAASIRADAAVSSTYPAPGVNVTADLSASAPGVHGPPTRFRADWGDGTVTEWQDSPVLTHAYAEPGTRTARFQAANDAGQTASAFVAFQVGASPPPELNLLQRAFAPEHLDTTWGVIGLLVVLLGALLGALRLRRRRTRLQRELRAIDEIYQRAKADPLAVEAALAERRACARGLVVDGHLDAAELGVLERRLDELGTSVRLESIDENLPFLPVAMARTLREMLADGRIQHWERDHFLAVLAEDGYLTEQQKALVREQIEAWFARDAPRKAVL